MIPLNSFSDFFSQISIKSDGIQSGTEYGNALIIAHAIQIDLF